MMRRLPVIVVPGGPMRAILAALTDWSAAGLVQPFAWVESSGFSAHDIEAVVVRHGQPQGGSLHDLLAAVDNEDFAVCVVVPAIGRAATRPADRGTLPAEGEQRVATVADRAGRQLATRVRCLVARPGGEAGAAVSREGWHNVLLSPEDAAGPSVRSVPLSDGGDPQDVGTHAAVGLAGVLGLWADVESAPLDTLAAAPGETVRLSQSFYRRFSAADVETALRAAVMSTRDGLPRPLRLGSRAAYIEDVDLAAGQMADAWWRRHVSALRGPRVVPKPVDGKPIGAFTALKLFFGFLVAAIRNAPEAWFHAAVRGVSSETARRVHSFVFGSAPSAWTVVVNGVTGDGRPADWLSTGGAAVALDAALTEAGQTRDHEAHSDFGALWADFAAGALTLADGADRVSEMPPIHTGADLAVARNPDVVVPGRGSEFRALPGQVAAMVAITEVEAFDVLKVHTLLRRLKDLADRPGLELEVDTAQNDIRRWRSATRASYAVQVGERVGRLMLDTTSEVRHALEALRDGGADPAGAERAAQQRVTNRVRLISVLMVLLLVLVAVLTGVGVIALLLGIGLFAVVLVGSFIALGAVFFNGQRELFRLLNRRQQAEAEDEALRQNLRQAVRDLRHQFEAYGQFLEWSRVIAALLAAPFGPAPASAAGRLRLGGPLPRAFRVGNARPDDRVIAEVAADIRRQLFQVGWLSEVWEALVASAGEVVGPEAFELRERPESLYSQLAASTVGPDQSVLSRWSAAVAAQGIGANAGERLWSSVQRSLESGSAGQVSRLLGQIEVPDTGKLLTMPEFLADIAGGDNTGNGAGGGAGQHRIAPSGTFDTAMLSASASNRRAAVVAHADGASSNQGLGRTAVLTRFSDSIPSYDILVGTGQQWRPDAVPDAPEPGSAPISWTVPDGNEIQRGKESRNAIGNGGGAGRADTAPDTSADARGSQTDEPTVPDFDGPVF